MLSSGGGAGCKMDCEILQVKHVQISTVKPLLVTEAMWYLEV